jgi:hypothetical protein
MRDPLALDEQLLSLLDESACFSTYKPALLPALFDRVQARLIDRVQDQELTRGSEPSALYLEARDPAQTRRKAVIAKSLRGDSS